MRRIKARKLSNGSWGLDYTCVFSIRHREKATNQREARGLEDRRGKERATGICELCKNRKERSKGLKVSLRFQDISRDYIEWEQLQGKKSVNTDRYSLKPLEQFFGDMLLSNIKPRDIDRYKIDRLKTLKPGTVIRELSVLKRLFNVCIDIWELPGITNPVKKIGLRENKKLVYLEPGEIGRLEDTCYNYKSMEGLLLITGLKTGLRKKNLFNLRWGHNLNVIDSIKHGEIIEIHIPAKESKNGEPLNTWIIDKRLIGKIKELKALNNEYVFVNKKTGKPFRDLRHFLKRALHDSGILPSNQPRLEGFSFHSLRHSFASNLTKKGVNIQNLMKAGGWKSVQMAMRYSHLSGEDTQDTLSLLSGETEKVSTTVSTFEDRAVQRNLK